MDKLLREYLMEKNKKKKWIKLFPLTKISLYTSVLRENIIAFIKVKMHKLILIYEKKVRLSLINFSKSIYKKMK